MKRFHIITLFPDMITSYVSDSILDRARKGGYVEVYTYNPRDYSTDKHRGVDDTPYGGGPGMVLSVQPLVDTVEHIYATHELSRSDVHIIITSPGGTQFTNTYAQDSITHHDDIIIICGRYEGIDSRVRDMLMADEVSIGDYVLTGGELPALVMIDAMVRRIKGVLGNYESLEEERISSHEMYTRPEVIEYYGKEYRVPEILLSGNHKKIEEWREGK